MRILMGLREPQNRDFTGIATRERYNLVSARSPQELLFLAGRQEYERYLVDLTFDNTSGQLGKDIVTLWTSVRERVKKEQARFQGISHYPAAIQDATKLGIPAELTALYSERNFRDFIRPEVCLTDAEVS